VSADETALGLVLELTEAKLLELIESAYPNPVTVEELATQHGWDADAVNKTLTTLQEKGLVEALEHGAFTRAGQADMNVQVCFLLLNGTAVSLWPLALIKYSIFMIKSGVQIFNFMNP
jgi:predicted transcriptional regulator